MARWFDGSLVRWMRGKFDISLVLWFAGSMDRWFDGCLESLIDRWFDGSLDLQTHIHRTSEPTIYRTFHASIQSIESTNHRSIEPANHRAKDPSTVGPTIDRNVTSNPIINSNPHKLYSGSDVSCGFLHRGKAKIQQNSEKFSAILRTKT